VTLEFWLLQQAVTARQMTGAAAGDTFVNVSFDQFRESLDRLAVERLEAYLALILKWNARINLTAVRDPDDIVQRHFVECIFAAAQIPANVKTLLDFGSGAGLPGIPIAICRPEIGVTLAESQGKKAAFLREAVRTLGLTAEVWDRRVEQMPPQRVFDAVTLRAVDKMAEACAAAVQRLAPGGSLMAFATRKTEAALEGLPGVEWRNGLPVPGSDHGILKIGRRN
jgi:16S rRNA (guanine527-N7)-methyltransferase